MTHETVQSRNGDRTSIRSSILALRSANEQLRKSRNHEVLCPLPGMFQQREDSLQFLECICQTLQVMGRQLLRQTTLEFDANLLIAADAVVSFAFERDYLLRGISAIPGKPWLEYVGKLYGSLEHLPQADLQMLSSRLLKLILRFESLLVYIDSTEFEDDSSVRELTSRFSGLFMCYSNIERNFLPHVS